MYEITGTVKSVGEIERYGNFEKKVLILKVNGEFPKVLPFEFANKQIAKLDNVKSGQDVTVKFDVDGKEWKDKVFVNLRAFGIQADEMNQDTAYLGGGATHDQTQ